MRTIPVTAAARTAARTLSQALARAAAVLAVAAASAHGQRAESARVARPAADSARLARRVALAPADSTPHPPISPKRAFLYSLAAPGLGQARLGRSTAAGLFAGVEFASLLFARKSAFDLRVAKQFARDSAYVGFLYANCPTLVDPVTGRVVPPGLHCATPVLGSNGQPVRDTIVTNYYQSNRIGARRLHYEDWIAVLVFNHLISGADAFISAQLWDLPARVAVDPADRRRATLTVSVAW